MYLKSTLFAAATTLLFAAASAQAADHVVHVGGAGLIFAPATTNAVVGDTVTFVNDGGFHNAVSDPGSPISFRCADGCDGSGGDGTPSNAAWSGTITITPAAAHSSIGYFCEVHEGQGMVGTINVTDPVDLQSFEID
jgi:plastocyanin